ncbi:DNA repair protein RadC [Novosphingobium sp. 1949]|uniref:DNA repair protein RadC n=1 Tax=Novosphingobium organovorum TaxID=2930092 RepID=A0ABT0B8G3_9SPHN|nr:DNA repair protein RadC [Novosphingobium organovorum]MCJ2181361.1 DNA repair protein RadC [Novosphingobium organovorum]
MPDDSLLFPEHPDREPGRGQPGAASDEARATTAKAGSDPSGHRSRLRQRLIGGGPDALADHEVIELLLMQAVPRRDMKPLARSLLQRFGSLAGVLQADPRTLAAHPGMGEATAAALRIVTVAATRLARQKVREAPVIGSWQALIDYLTIDMAHLTLERVRVLYLNTKNMLILDDLVGEGSIDEAAIHPREVIRRALDIGASALILVHNHPSGSPEPSRADIEITNRISEAGRLLGVAVHDHVVIGREGHVSLRAKGLI